MVFLTSNEPLTAPPSLVFSGEGTPGELPAKLRGEGLFGTVVGDEYRQGIGILSSMGEYTGKHDGNHKSIDFSARPDIDDFMALCREIGAEPFVTINPTWNTPEENAEWVEYCNGTPDTKYGALRVERGHEAPYHVRFWSLGNEFGYGHMEGDNTPIGYSRLALKNADKMLSVCDKLCLCSCGPYPSAEWSAHAALPLSGVAPLVSLHYYASSPAYADPQALEREYDQCLSSVMSARSKLRALRSTLTGSMKISFDEWNTWSAWYRPSCVTDGLFTALMLHMLIGEADETGIAMACHFEAVNEGMIEVDADTAALTASGQAFSLIQRHAGGKLLCASLDAVVTAREDRLTATVINPSLHESRRVKLSLYGRLARAQIYTSQCVTPHTRFDIRPIEAECDHGAYIFLMPPHSMLYAELEESETTPDRTQGL